MTGDRVRSGATGWLARYRAQPARMVVIAAVLVTVSSCSAAPQRTAQAGDQASQPRTTSTPAQPPSSEPTSTPAAKPTAKATGSIRPVRPLPNPAPLTSRPASPARPAGLSALPIAGSTGAASQAITVSAPSLGATQASLQAWDRTPTGWFRNGPPAPAWLGYAGLSTSAHEGFSGTPEGSFGLTQAFGNDADPGTKLPYFQAGPNDWWSGDGASPTYNTHQRCVAASCPFDTGESENLHDAGWVYGYAVVIDYNTAPVVPGKGSAFFLHVTENQPTEGCVSIQQDALVRILRWLDPARHPRILLGVG